MSRSRRTTRQAISEVIDALPRGVHLSAQELKERVEVEGESVSLSTVYRALEKLQDAGEVRSIMSTRGQLWEAASDSEPHDHLICTSCGLTIEFSDVLVSGFGQSLAERKGYKYQESRFDIFGYCSECKRVKNAASTHAVKEVMENMLSACDENAAALRECMQSIEDGKVSGLTGRLNEVKKRFALVMERCDTALELLD